ncbi:MAG: rod shape-determining protein MreC [Planctomycetes bacterium]|nr:rod shape-determining protein MreC [Planctomycetota bacterium]
MSWHQRYELSNKGLFKLLMLFSLVSLLLLPQGLTDLADQAVWWLLSPISRGGRTFVQGSSIATTEVSEGDGVTAERYLQAETQIINLQQQLRQEQDRVIQLAGLKDFFGEAPMNFTERQVVGSDVSSWRDLLILNQSGLKPGQIVISGVKGSVLTGSEPDYTQERLKMCVVGQITKNSDAGFRVQLLTDSGFSLPVQIKPRWDRQEHWVASGTLKGQRGGEIEVDLVKASEPVQVGDAVIAQSDPRRLPVQMVVGFVKSCRRDPDNAAFLEITVEPAADLPGLHYVYIISTQWTK